MCDPSEMTFVAPGEADMRIVPCPHHDDAWAVVNRRGDVLANGDYAHCVRRLRRMTSPPV